MTASESPHPTSTTRRMPVVEAIGDDHRARRVLPECCSYRRRLAEQLGSGRLDAEAQLRVQRIIARQGEDVGALGVGDSLDDGALTGVERAGARIEKRTREGSHSRPLSQPERQAPSPGD